MAGALDVEALREHIAAVRRGARIGREPAAEPHDLVVTPEQARWRRLVATNAAVRLSPGCFADAAAPGLQDSSPRSGQLALHARVEHVQPGAWEHPSLRQLWFRGADYIVPADDLGLFTLGSLPRDERRAAALVRCVWAATPVDIATAPGP